MSGALARSDGESDADDHAVATTMGRSAEALLPVLLYHDVADGRAGDRFRRYVVSPSLFDEHLSAVASAGYRTANASALVSAGLPGTDPRPTVYLTFDDAYRSFATTIVPTMAHYAMTGTVFVPTAYVGGPAEWLADVGEDHRQLMTWAEISEVVAAGAEVGAHGHRHLPFDLLSPQQLHSELGVSRTMLEDRLGHAVTTLAFPYGFHHRSVRASARAHGYRIAFEVGDNLQRGLGPTPGGDRILRIRRIVVGPETSGDDLLGLLRHGRRAQVIQRTRCMVRPGWRLLRRLSLDRHAQ